MLNNNKNDTRNVRQKCSTNQIHSWHFSLALHTQSTQRYLPKLILRHKWPCDITISAYHDTYRIRNCQTNKHSSSPVHGSRLKHYYDSWDKCYAHVAVRSNDKTVDTELQTTDTTDTKFNYKSTMAWRWTTYDMPENWRKTMLQGQMGRRSPSKVGTQENISEYLINDISFGERKQAKLGSV